MRLRFIVTVGLLSACTTGATPTHAAVFDAAEDTASDALDDVSNPFTPIACNAPCAIQWAEIRAYDTEVSGHTLYTALRGNEAYLYLLGGGVLNPRGTFDQYNSRVSAAKIEENGSLGAWQHRTLGRNAAVGFAARFFGELDDGIQFIGVVGGLSPQTADPTQTGFLGGSLALTLEGTRGSGLPESPTFLQFGPLMTPPHIYGSNALILHTSLHTIGGRSAQPAGLSEVLSTTTRATTWREELPMNEGRSFATQVWASYADEDDDFYILGGIGDVTGPAIEIRATATRAHVENGRIVRWSAAGAAPQVYGARGVLWNNHVYVMGGADLVGVKDDIRRAAILADGTLAPFETVGHLPERLVFSDIARLANRIYICGGVAALANTNFNHSRRCFVGQFVDPEIMVDAAVADAHGNADARTSD